MGRRSISLPGPDLERWRRVGSFGSLIFTVSNYDRQDLRINPASRHRFRKRIRMGRWWRAYDEAVDDPKLCLLSDKQHRAWFNLCCITSQNGGILPPISAIAFKLRMTVSKAKDIVAELVALKLIDIDSSDGTFTPHNWSVRQFQSDVSTERVKRHRERKRNVSSSISETPPESEADTEQITEAKASGADAPIDHRKRLFNEGLEKLQRMTGKGPDSCRSYLGKCLKEAQDDAVIVLGLIEDAERNQVVDPSAWIASRLKTRENGNGQAKRGIIQAADDLRRKVASFDGPPSRDIELRDRPSAAPVRLLPNGGRE